jgi:hypothetical protein
MHLDFDIVRWSGVENHSTIHCFFFIENDIDFKCLVGDLFWYHWKNLVLDPYSMLNI